MTSLLSWVVYVSAAVPMFVALRTTRGTTLFHAATWAWFAWLAWGLALTADDRRLDYAALCITGSAGVAVFGARRPGVTAWNFVVGSLLVVLLLPVAEGMLTGTGLQLGWFRTTFVTVLVGATVINYLPTRLGIGAVALGASCGLTLAGLWDRGHAMRPLLPWLIGIVPWVAWIGMPGYRTRGTAFDRQWMAFRDRYGLVWGQRLREQFNCAAVNAGWAATLRWRGLQAGTQVTDVQRREMEGALAALMKRFGPPI
jgi:hypothetical protein